MKAVAIVAAGLALVANGAFAEDLDLAAGEKVFAKCKACHAVGADAKNKVGPELNGVVGRTWGAVDGFKYSKTIQGMAGEGMVWDDAALHAFLKDPKGFVAKTKMSFAGFKDQADIGSVAGIDDLPVVAQGGGLQDHLEHQRGRHRGADRGEVGLHLPP